MLFRGYPANVKESFPLFSGYEMAPLWRFSSVYYCNDCRLECFGNSDSTL